MLVLPLAPEELVEPLASSRNLASLAQRILHVDIAHNLLVRHNVAHTLALEPADTQLDSQPLVGTYLQPSVHNLVLPASFLHTTG